MSKMITTKENEKNKQTNKNTVVLPHSRIPQNSMFYKQKDGTYLENKQKSIFLNIIHLTIFNL